MESRGRPLVEKTAGVWFPAAPGTYALLLHLQEPATLRVGKLGVFTLPEQDYILDSCDFAFRGLSDDNGMKLELPIVTLAPIVKQYAETFGAVFE
ncbi:MAG: hypothetical protein M1434_00600, partial [Chloroflexi bacterium]|nr:hypothetical protein [Chloroflexota bacterium]MCL5273232.1 hypothetical protein [Chloroflexota bacterium]